MDPNPDSLCCSHDGCCLERFFLLFYRQKKMQDEAIVKPRPLKKFQRKRTLYIPFDFPDGLLLSSFQKYILKEMDLGYGRLFLFKDKIILYKSVGAPAAVLALESLIASGTREIITLGICGSLNSGLRLLEAAVISKAFSEEGTSRHYFPEKKIFHSSSALNNLIEKTLAAEGLSFHKGSVVSTDAPFRETKSWLTRMQERGVDLVDMEASAVFALAEYHRIEAAALRIISDELYRKKWRTGFRFLRMRRRMKDYFLPFILDS